MGVNLTNSKPTISINEIISQYNKEHNTNLEPLVLEEILARTVNNIETLVDDFQDNGSDSFLTNYYKHWLHRFFSFCLHLCIIFIVKNNNNITFLCTCILQKNLKTFFRTTSFSSFFFFLFFCFTSFIFWTKSSLLTCWCYKMFWNFLNDSFMCLKKEMLQRAKKVVCDSLGLVDFAILLG